MYIGRCQGLAFAAASLGFPLTVAVSLADAPPSALAQCYAASATRIGVSDCLRRKVAEADEALAEALAAAQRQAAGLDAVASRSTTLAALERSQEAFRAYQDAECTREAAQVGAGTGAADVERDCRVRLARIRIGELRASGAARNDRRP